MFPIKYILYLYKKKFLIKNLKDEKGLKISKERSIFTEILGNYNQTLRKIIIHLANSI